MKNVRRLKRKRPNNENFKNEELKKYSVPEKGIFLFIMFLLLSCCASAEMSGFSVSKVVLSDVLYDNVDELRVRLSFNGNGNFSVVDKVWDFYDEIERYYKASDSWSTEYSMSVYRGAEDYELNISSVRVFDDSGLLLAESLPFTFLVRGFNYVPEKNVSTQRTLVVSLIVVLILIIAVILLIIRRKETAAERGDDYELVEVEEE